MEFIESLRSELRDIFLEDVDGLFDEMDSLLVLSLEDRMQFHKAQNPKERIDKLFSIIIQIRNSTCQKFLDHLEFLIPRFPRLSELLYEKRKSFYEMLLLFKMNQYLTSKLTLKDILDIGQESLYDDEPRTVEEIPRHFLWKLMALNRSARITRLKQCSETLVTSLDDKDHTIDYGLVYDDNEVDSANFFHPLDVLCVLMHCSDSFLQQEILSKMSMCQFAVPLLLPAGDGQQCTLMLWAMRDVVKRWRPQSLAESKGFIEDSLVHIPMLTFSFVRLGKSKLSKSKILNSILSSGQQNHDFFIHENMECGNIQRKLSDGLVEISWYFPAGRDTSDTFPEPIAVTNLRGDLKSNWTQFSFLTQVSSAVFIIVESLSESEFQLLTQINNSDTKYYFIISPSNGKRISKETFTYLEQLSPKLRMDKRNILMKGNNINDAALAKHIQGTIRTILEDSSRSVSLEGMSHIAIDLGIHVDENSEECKNANEWITAITSEITNVVQYKKETLKLQGDLWKELSQIEKEMCRLRGQGAKNGEEYKSELRDRHLELHKKQNQHELPNGMSSFIAAITHLSKLERTFYVKWMKFKLDAIARKTLTSLKTEYKEKCNDILKNEKELKTLDKEISESSLGVEHFLRELGQLYEAECSMVRQRHVKDRQFTKLPGMAADLLLGGFPLELIDGDASNIPLQWVTAVLTELNNKTGGHCRMRVITVLGVQSTGKSTLLNTMFGLQFPVSSGRCTRGAFMTLINVKENFKQELGCDFILVIDTEGLKAPELASLEESYEHDNELATLVIGLSDITIINMAMENTAEMKDILQIVVHAFLRMKEIGKKPNCQFVHQNVSDVSAHENNMRDRKKLLEQLDEMTRAAANMEKKSGITKFSDVMNYDFENNNWYIPGLWLGVPPMAPVNCGYSENTFKLKKYLFEVIKSFQDPQNISQFIKWIKSLWNAVKYEKFIFSFRNSLVAEAYNHLSMQYSQWEWEFTKQVHNWFIKTETFIRNQSADQLQMETCGKLKADLHQVVGEEEKKMSDLLKNHFENGSENVNLIERYREDFFRSLTFLRKELERNTASKIEEALRVQKGKYEVQCIQDRSQKLIEGKVTNLLETCRRNRSNLEQSDIVNAFEKMWQETLTELGTGALQERNISEAILRLLRNDMHSKAGSINEKLLSLRNLLQYSEQDFKMDDKYIDTTWRSLTRNKLYISSEYSDKTQRLAISLLDACGANVTEKVRTPQDYDDTYCLELLHMINRRLEEEDVKKLYVTSMFELDIKLLILGRAAPEFQKMHNNFIQENDPKLCLQKLKPQYLSTFENIFHERDECQSKAKSFCDLCLKPAITEHIYVQLGKEIVGDVLLGDGSLTFCSRSFFQYTILEELLKNRNFEQYVEYINEYERFVKKWIRKYISDKYKSSPVLQTLQANILFSIITKINKVLKTQSTSENPSLPQFLEKVCSALDKELVISQDKRQVILFQNTANVKRFSADIELFLRETEGEIIWIIKHSSIETVLSKVRMKPQDELFKKVFGCGKQCPFCKVPCEAGAGDHSEHFASVHRPQGLGTYRRVISGELVTSICSTDVVSDGTFRNTDTSWEYHPYKDYRKFYPDWAIQPDPSIDSSDYWKFIYKHFNQNFAENYNAKPAKLPAGWNNITAEDALRSLKETFNMN